MASSWKSWLCAPVILPDPRSCLGKEPKGWPRWYVIQRVTSQSHATRKEKQKVLRTKTQQIASPELACGGRFPKAPRTAHVLHEPSSTSSSWRNHVSVIAKLWCHKVVLWMNRERENAMTWVCLTPSFSEKAWGIIFPSQESQIAIFIGAEKEWYSGNNLEPWHLGISLATLENSVNFHASIQSASTLTEPEGQRKVN